MASKRAAQNFFVDFSSFSLSGPGGQRVILSPVGAQVQAVFWPDGQGRIKNIALPSRDPGDYAGAVLGPLAGRLAESRFSLSGRTLQVPPNEGANLLHGGARGLSHRVWALAGGGSNAESAELLFCCHVPHGSDGFPGNRTFTARYRLTENALELRLLARSDAASPVNLSSHLYWNLSGAFDRFCAGHTLQIAADSVLYNSAAHLPAALLPCRGTAFDFSAPRALPRPDALPAVGGDPLADDLAQLANAHGLNNAFLLRQDSPFAARLACRGSGLALTVFTDQPYLVVYSGGYLPVPGCAVALEAQQEPGSAPLLLPGREYQRLIRFEFSLL